MHIALPRIWGRGFNHLSLLLFMLLLRCATGKRAYWYRWRTDSLQANCSSCWPGERSMKMDEQLEVPKSRDTRVPNVQMLHGRYGVWDITKVANMWFHILFIARNKYFKPLAFIELSDSPSSETNILSRVNICFWAWWITKLYNMESHISLVNH
jgi:hypothetical protein